MDVHAAVSAFWNIYDEDGNGVLDREEARKMMRDIIQELQTEFGVKIDSI